MPLDIDELDIVSCPSWSRTAIHARGPSRCPSRQSLTKTAPGWNCSGREGTRNEKGTNN